MAVPSGMDGYDCPSSAGADLRVAQRFFLAASAVPPLAYYLGRERTFPATISWTIRSGWSKWMHHVLWLSGWYCTARAVSEVEGRAGLGLCVVMVCVGVVAVMLAPIGFSKRLDCIHYAASLAYILLHIPWFRKWCIPVLPYQAGFYASLLLFLLNMSYSRYLKRAHIARGSCGHQEPQQITSVGLRQWLQTKEASQGQDGRRRGMRQLYCTLYRLELVEMVLENAIFVFFVAGMTARWEARPLDGTTLPSP